MATGETLTRVRNNLTGIVSTVVTGVWLAALFSGQDWWLAFMLFGYIVVVPLTALLFGDKEDIEEWWEDKQGIPQTTHDSETDATTRDEALDTLRERYAKGELTDEQFERKADQLIQMETIEDLEDLDDLEDDHRESVTGRQTESETE